MPLAKHDKCICCSRSLEPLKPGSAAGPVCYPCYWGAKLFYENKIETIEGIPVQLIPMISGMFQRSGYTWPDDLLQSWKDKHFAKKDTEMERWWFPASK